MKRLLVLLSVLLLAVPVTYAGRKRKKTGKIDNGVYLDRRFPFTLKVHKNWKAKPRKEEGKGLRLVLVQRNWDIPNDYLNVPDYTKVPSVDVYVDTCSMGVYPLIDSLLSPTYKSERKKQIYKWFEFLNEPDIIPKGKSSFEFGGERGLIWKGESKYVKEIQTSAGSAGGRRVYRSYGGAMFASKHNGFVFIADLMCEWEYIQPVLSEVAEMMRTLQWTDGKDAADKK